MKRVVGQVAKRGRRVAPPGDGGRGLKRWVVIIRHGNGRLRPPATGGED